MMDTRKPLRKDGIMSRQLGNEWILYDTASGAVHVVNSMAEFVWRMCDGSHNLVDIENGVCNAHVVPEGRNVSKDLEDIIRKFADLGVISVL
jgi:hypothetical protein